METVRTWAMGICTAAVISAAVTALIPRGSLEKSVRAVVSVFLICSIVSPLIAYKGSYINESSIFIEEETEAALYDEIARQTENQIKRAVEDVLRKNGIQFEKVDIQLELKEEEIVVTSVSVINTNTASQNVKQLIMQELGIEAEVINTE